MNTFKDKKSIHRMIIVIFIACFIKACILDIYYLLGHGVPFGINEMGETTRKVVTYDPADLIAFVTIVVVAFTFIFTNGLLRKRSIFLLFCIAPMLFAIIFSFRRAIWLGIIISFGLIFLLNSKVVKNNMVLFICLVIFFMLPICFLSTNGNILKHEVEFSALYVRALSILDENQGSNKHHILEAKQTLKEISMTPILGLGLGSKHKPVKNIDWAPEKQPTHIVHNTWLYFWMKTGLFGLLFFIWISIKYIKVITKYRGEFGRNPNPIVDGIAATMGLWFILTLISPIPAFYSRSFLISLFSALVISIIQIEKKDIVINNALSVNE